MLDAVVENDDAKLSALLGGVDMAEHWTHFPEAFSWTRDYLQEHTDEFEWWNYMIVHKTDVRLIGSCGYKGRPTPDGLVEIGYEIAEPYQGRGLATEVARALTENALANPGVKIVVAHTLAQENASVAILRKLGYVFMGEKFDPEDGPIWEWHLHK